MDSVAGAMRALLARTLLEPLFTPLEKSLGPLASQAFGSVLERAVFADEKSDG